MSAIIKNWFNIIIRLPIIAAICFFLMQTCCNLSLKGFFVPQNNIYQTVLIDSRFTDREVKLIIGVTEEWSIKTHGVVKYNIITGFDVEMYHQLDSSRIVLVIFKMSKDDDYIKVQDAKIGNSALGYFDNTGIGPIIAIVSDRLLFASDEYYFGLIIHEFGHALGLDHSEKEGTVMYPTMDKSAMHLTTSDIRQFCKVYMCSKSNFESK